ncbi:MAG: phosphoenolpyruvate--protein phosphotransferase [Candidatus Omnitrophica bacterium]|nr:phosphoenolpyruvate--protein phosphotransferase [Candidatus Omnitrophota bacterium]
MSMTGGKNRQKILKGKRINHGYAIGRAFVYEDILSRDLYYYTIRPDDVERELGRIRTAFGKVLEDIRKLEKNVKAELGREEADIFKVHAEMLRDEALLKDLEKEIKGELVNAEHAVRNVFRKWANKFKVSDSEVVKSKAEDIEDLSRRILCSFMRCDINMLENVPRGSVIVAKRLLPSDTARLKRSNVKGIIVEQGSDVSHSAIIARALGIPAVTELQNATGIIATKSKIILDGYESIVIKEPTSGELKTYRKKIREIRKEETARIKRARKPARTASGDRVRVLANVASKDDIKAAAERGYEGIGLWRIEQIYMSSKILPDEKHLIRKLSKMLKPVKRQVVTLRLLDIGADKDLPYIDIEDEPSPALGMRGVRVLLRYKNLLRTQLKVASILSKDHNVRVLVPVVTFPEEMEEVKRIAKECVKELKEEYGIRARKIRTGAMIETPAAVENIDRISLVSDFVSIGTNDLIQYSVAAGRDNPSVLEYYEKGAGLALKYIKRIVRSAERHGIECSVCGEMAAEDKWIKPLVKAGVRVLSASPYLIPRIKEKIRAI